MSEELRCNFLGVMQGRLLPKYRGRYQAHPVGYWQGEFSVAAELGLDCIEFILDLEDAEQNPLLRAGGSEEILRIASETGVAVKTVCADYFMEAPLHHRDCAVATHSEAVLRRLLNVGAQLGLRDIVIPCVDQSSIQEPAKASLFSERLAPLLEEANKAQINLCLETDLAPEPFAELLEHLGSERVTVNYDTGNSAALGYDPQEELRCYGDRITDIHLKDRIRGGGSVVLGTGDAQFERFFAALPQCAYSGPFIMQAFRDDEGLEVFRTQLEWIRPYLTPWIQGKGS
jgi:L-ribulose-5-phosphate 3-epimerase